MVAWLIISYLLLAALFPVASRHLGTVATNDSVPSSPVPVQGALYPTKRFFIYNLSEEFWWRWPVNGTQDSCRENGYLGHEHAELSAIGRLISADDGLFLTWHFSMFNSLFNRLKRSRRRTLDPEKADMFIIPYDIGLDGYMNSHTCKNRMQCSHGMVGKLTQALSATPYFAKHKGADHVVLWSLGQYHPWPRAGCDVFMKNYCALCTLSCYWMDPTKADNRFVSMPFPSAYHWWDGIKNVPWDVSRADARNLTAVYLGSTQTLNPAHTKIRRAMAAQCNASTECHWLRIAHSSIDNSIGDFLSIYKRATFCLCPPGDDPARKAVFDSIVSGCIPVIFELATLYNQYPWHIGERAALDVSVYIPGGSVRSGKLDFMSVLRAISPEVVRKKQQALSELAPRVQYAIPPLRLLENRFDETPWDPPFLDAAEIAIDGFFERTQRVVANQSTGIPHRLMTGREWGQEYDSVKVKIPDGPLLFGQEPNSRPQVMGVAPMASTATATVTATTKEAGTNPDASPGGGVHTHHRKGGGAGGTHGDPKRAKHRPKHHPKPPSMAAPGEEEAGAEVAGAEV